MSNSLAIGAVTATLQQLLTRVSRPLPLDPLPDPELGDATCTVRPLDRARTSEDANQVNLFLYQTAVSAALRNAWMPDQHPGDLTQPPLALELYYLLTAYGRNFDEVLSHRVLGRAMSILHDSQLLYPDDIEKALPGNDLGRQVERIHITPRPMTSEELSKLWTMFTVPYRISASYEVRVVLIDANRRSRAAPPIILRAAQDRGNDASATLLPALPELLDLGLPNAKQPAARLPYTDPDPTLSRLGDTVSVIGHDLGGGTITAVLTHRLGPEHTLGPPAVSAVTAAGFSVTLPDAPGTWPAGIYSLAAVVTPAADPPRTTNALPLVVAPRIVGVSPVGTDPDGNPTLSVTISPPVWAQQRVSLLVGDLEYVARPLPSNPPVVSTVAFNLAGRGAGTYSLRVRVDGVDSFLVRYDAKPLDFDPDAMLQVTLP